MDLISNYFFFKSVSCLTLRILNNLLFRVAVPLLTVSLLLFPTVFVLFLELLLFLIFALSESVTPQYVVYTCFHITLCFFLSVTVIYNSVSEMAAQAGLKRNITSLCFHQY